MHIQSYAAVAHLDCYTQPYADWNTDTEGRHTDADVHPYSNGDSNTDGAAPDLDQSSTARPSVVNLPDLIEKLILIRDKIDIWAGMTGIQEPAIEIHSILDPMIEELEAEDAFSRGGDQ